MNILKNILIATLISVSYANIFAMGKGNSGNIQDTHKRIRKFNPSNDNKKQPPAKRRRCNREQTSLHIATKSGSLEGMADIIKQYKVNINMTDESGMTALHIAAQIGNVQKIKWLISQNANVNQSNCFGTTPLHIACICGHTNAAETLLDADADVEAKTICGSTPLDWAACSPNEDVIDLLIERGANVNTLTSYEKTPLHHAAERGLTEIAKLLIGYGAIVPASLLPQLASLKITEIPETQINRFFVANS